MMGPILEISLALMSFYIIYRSPDLVTNLIYFATGLSCIAIAATSFADSSMATQHVLFMEHRLIQAAIFLRFWTVIRSQMGIKYHHNLGRL